VKDLGEGVEDVMIDHDKHNDDDEDDDDSV